MKRRHIGLENTVSDLFVERIVPICWVAYPPCGGDYAFKSRLNSSIVKINRTM